MKGYSHNHVDDGHHIDIKMMATIIMRMMVTVVTMITDDCYSREDKDYVHDDGNRRSHDDQGYEIDTACNILDKFAKTI